MFIRPISGGAGILFGALIGGISGLLLSPRSGRENREMVKNRVSQAKIEAKSRMDQFQSKMRRNRAESNQGLEGPVASQDGDYLH